MVEGSTKTAVAVSWQAHEAPGYHRLMQVRCQTLLDEIQTCHERRVAVLTQPHETHRALFEEFTPLERPEYAGMYRGTAGTSLEGRVVQSASYLMPGQDYSFCPPQDVASAMEDFLAFVQEIRANASWASDYEALNALATCFAYFGEIHPFLDGNGHVQRAIFAALAVELGYPLSARFSIHPRPYNELLSIALELFTRKSDAERLEVAPLIAEYLGLFLDGPFTSAFSRLGRQIMPADD